MARIPVYEQQTTANGARLPDSMQAVRVRSAVGESFGAIGQAIDRNVAVAEENKRLAKAAEEDDATADIAQRLADGRLRWTEESLKRRETAPAGAQGYTEGLTKDFDTWAAEQVKSAPTERAREMLQLRLTDLRTSLLTDSMQWEAGRRRENRVATVTSAIDKAAVAAELNPDQFEALLAEQVTLAQQLEMHPDDRDKLAQQAADRIAVGAVVGQIRRAAGTKQPGPLREVLSALTTDEPQGAVALLDLQAKMNLRNQVEGELRSLEAEARARRAEARVAFERRLTDSTAMFLTAGYDPNPISPGEFVAMYGPEEGAREAERYARTQRLGADRVELRAMPIAEQQALLQSRRPVPGDPDYAKRVQEYASLEQAHREVLQAIQADEVAYAAQAGIADVGPIDLTNPEAAASELRKREAAAQILARDFGGSGRMLTASESANLAKIMEESTAAERAELLATMRAGLSRDAYLRQLGELRPDSPVTAIAGAVAETNPRRAEVMLAGEDLLNPSKTGRGGDGRPQITMPRDDAMDRVWRDAVGSAYAGAGPQAEAAAKQAFRAYYAAAAHRLGRLDPLRVDPEVADAALRAATGGVAEVNGTQILLPYDMPKEQAVSLLRSEWSQVRASAGLGRVEFDEVRLSSVQDGEYMVTDGVGPVLGPDGNPLRISVKPAMQRHMSTTDVPTP